MNNVYRVKRAESSSDAILEQRKLSVVKLDRLDSFIAAVVPMDNNDKVTNDFSKNTPDIGKYIMG